MNPSSVKRYGQYEVLADSDGRDAVHALGTHDITYRAIDRRLDRRVHLRVLRPEFLPNTALKDAFLAATRSLARIRHSNISGVLDVGEGVDGCYCAIEDPSGESLEGVVNRLGFLDAHTALSILDQCAKALRELWQSGQIITRLSPAAIAVCYEGDELIVKFTDLHLASSSESGAVLAVGKSTDARADFWSPEETVSGALDIRSNIYSLGLVFCELLGGRGSSRSFLALGDKSSILQADPFRKLPEKILYLLELMLERDPARRIQTPYDLRSLIEQCEREGGGADSPLIRTGRIFATARGEVRPDDDILPQEFNLRNTLDAKGLYRHADDRVRGGEVVIRLFGADESPLEVATCASVAEKIAAHPHPNIVRVIRIQTEGRHRFIAYEMVAGNTLLEIMRKRRRLTLPEVLILLAQAASAADHGVEHDVAGLAFNLSIVRILGGGAVPGEKNEVWMSQPCHQWPSFTLKIPFYGSLPDLDEDPSLIAAQSTREKRLASYLRALGETAHELLGGVRPRNIPFSEESYTPLSTLSEQGNILLRRALFGGEKPLFASASEFVNTLKSTVADKDFPSSSLGPANPRGETASLPESSGLPSRELMPRKKGLAAVCLLLIVIVAIIAALVFSGTGGKQTPAPLPPVAPQAQSVETPPALPVASDVPVAPPVQAPPPSLPSAETLPVPVASPFSNEPAPKESTVPQAQSEQSMEVPQLSPQGFVAPASEPGVPVTGEPNPKEQPAMSEKKPAPKLPISGTDAPKP